MTDFRFKTVRTIAIATPETEFVSGFNGDVDSGSVPEDIWPQGGLIPFPSAEATVSVVSDNVNDTSAGTGARSLVLVGVNDAFDVVTETIIMNGTTPVVSVANFLFVNSATVITAGSSSGNEGLITFTIGGNLCQVIAIGKSITQAAAHVFPVANVPGSVPHLVNFFASIGRVPGALATIEIVLRPAATGVDIFSIDVPFLASSPVNIPIVIPLDLDFAAGDRVTVRVAEMSANNVLVSAIMQFCWLNPQT